LEEIGDLNWGPAGWIAVAAGAVVLSPAARRGLRNAAVKATALCLGITDRVKGATTGAREGWSALVEEARSERAAAQQAQAS
jgi:hypothetical protein